MTQPYHHGDLRAALLAAAETILDRDGIAALTLRAAAREAGVSHAAPSHHFGNLSGLLSALAASGFARLRAQVEAEMLAAGPDQRSMALTRGYVGFARSAPGVFLLMFRSEQLDWSDPALAAAGSAALALMIEPRADQSPPENAELTRAMSHWASVHGLATLLIDGRFTAVAEAMLPGVDTSALLAHVMAEAGR